MYLTEEFQYVLGRKSIECVSGGIDSSERPFDAAKRELEEELGIKAAKWIELGVVNPFTSAILSPAYLFLAQKLDFAGSHQEGTESITMVKVKFVDAVKMVMESCITHGPSCVLILKAKECIGREEESKQLF